MTLVKCLSVGNGDMFYIRHASDNFTIIDCCVDEHSRDAILSELQNQIAHKRIVRFISTHPDDDHIRGLEYLDDQLNLLNFYCVENDAAKPDGMDDFDHYCDLRDSDKAFYLRTGCSRHWMNQSDDERGSAGISILWPDTTNRHFKTALKEAAEGKSPNNISPIIKYSQTNGATILWMGDLEKTFMEDIEDAVSVPSIDILFAPHHGRNSGKIPQAWLSELDPSIIVISEEPSAYLNYYAGYNTITQNSAGEVTFECDGAEVHVYTSSSTYSADFLSNECKANNHGHYIGTLHLG